MNAWRSMSALDTATLLYVAVALVFTLTRWPSDVPGAALLPLGLVLAGVVAGVLAPRARKDGPLGALLGEFYALALTFAFYTHVGILNAARGVAHDALLQRLEQTVFDGLPALAWIRTCPWPWLSLVMHAGYLSFYPILVVAPGLPWLRGGRDGARHTLLLMMVTFYVCYVLFLLFPVAGPRYLFPLPENAATAQPVAAFVHRLVAGGSAWGTAFPSSHVAVALVAAVSAGWAWRALGAVLLPLALLLALGTVYGQFHYAVDATAGAALAALVLVLGRRRPRAAEV